MPQSENGSKNSPKRTKNTAPDFTSKGVCDILKACRNLNVKKISFAGCDIEFHNQNNLDVPLETPVQAPLPSQVGLDFAQQKAEAQLAQARQDFEDKRVTSADHDEVQKLVDEQDLMMHNPSAWEAMQIDNALGNDKAIEQNRTNQIQTPGHRVYASQREEGVQ